MAYLVLISYNDLEAQEIARSLLQENDIQTNTISTGTKDKVLVPIGNPKNKSIDKKEFLLNNLLSQKAKTFKITIISM